MKPVRIAVFPVEQFSRYRRLFEGLSELYSIQFEPRAEADFAGCSAALLFGVARSEAERVANSGVRCVAWIKEQPLPVQSAAAHVLINSVPCVDPCLRGKTLRDRSIDQVRPLKAKTGDAVVATKSDDILWIHRDLENSSLDLLGVDPPCLTESEYLSEFLQRDNCMRLLPLLHCLRGLSPWRKPALRACLMFDDPNLHWKSYGYIRFKELAEHAGKHNYHASFATVPFDGWYVHRATAELFRENKSRLSLLVHGNNHTFAELAQTYRNGDQRALMAQALQRIEKLEKRSGLEISRVMAAPHGGCSADMAATLLEVGFEAACISRWSLLRHNPIQWYPTIALDLADFLAKGFPIIPRFKLAHDREVDIYLTALLQKPIILVGHHEDLKGGLDLLGEFAARINSVGKVTWMNMLSMARSNFCTHQDGDSLHVKIYSRRVQIKVPVDVKSLLVERAWLKAEEGETLRWGAQHKGFQTISSYRREPIPVEPGMEIEVASVFAGSVDPHEVPPPRTSFWAAARRGFCEVRDRAKPALDRFGKSAKKSIH